MSIMNYLIDRISDRLEKKLTQKPYSENLGELYTTSKKVPPNVLFETVLRAEQPTPPARPFGGLVDSPWQDLLFSPAQLHTLPSMATSVERQVTIGPGAKKPLQLEMPLLFAAMSYGGALSATAKIVLAKASRSLGTATNTGESFLPEEREYASHLIMQYHRGDWPNSPQNNPEVLRYADAVEIQLGQGAQAASQQRTSQTKMDDEFRRVFGLSIGEDAIIRPRLKGVNSAANFQKKVQELRSYVEVPIGVKFAAGDQLEQDLAIALDAGVDFITIDGAEGGTHGTTPTLGDDIGLPLLWALSRASAYLREEKATSVTLLATGGLSTPGEMVKALALGADAVYLGTVAMIAMATHQLGAAMPFHPPTSLVLYEGSKQQTLQEAPAIFNLENFFKNCLAEMDQVVLSIGKESYRQLDRQDLFTLNRNLAEDLNIHYGAHGRMNHSVGNQTNELVQYVH